MTSHLSEQEASRLNIPQAKPKGKSTAEFFLPWPNPDLSPNARVHWSGLWKAKKKAKDDAWKITLAAGIRKIDADTLLVRYSFYPPNKQPRDIDNLVASMKAAADGIALAIGVDDSKWQIEVEKKSAVMKNGRVKVELEWVAV